MTTSQTGIATAIRIVGLVLVMAVLLTAGPASSGHGVQGQPVASGNGVLAGQPEATPTADPPAATPVETPISGTPTPRTDAPCSSVLGVGTETDACVAFVNAVPASDPISFVVADADDSGADGLESGDFADFVAVPAATRRAIQSVDDGSPDDVLAEMDVPLDAGTAYVIVLEQRYDETGPSLTAVPLDLAPVAGGTSRLVFHHAVTDAAGLTVVGLDVPSDSVILPGETTNPIQINAGEYAVQLTPANDQSEVLATLDLELESDLSYLVIMGGSTGDETVTVIYAAAPVATQP